MSNSAKSLTDFPQRRTGRKAASSKSASNARKRELRTAYSPINPRIEFHDSDWSAIESASGIPLCPEKREKIRLISRAFVLAYAAAHNAFDAVLIEKHIRSVIEHAEALMKALQIRHNFATVDDWVAMEISKELFGEIFGRTLVPPVYNHLSDLVSAANAALPKLMEWTVEKSPGPKRGAASAMARFIQQLERVFEEAGGKPTIGGRRVSAEYREKGERYELRSDFGDFVHAVHSVLSRAEENQIPTRNLSSIGDYIRQVRRGEKSRP